MALSGYKYIGKIRPLLTSTERKAVPYLLLLIIVTLLFGVVLTKPTLERIFELVKTRREFAKTSGVLLNKIDNLKKAEEIYSNSESNIKLAESYLPDNPDLHRFISSLATKADNETVQLLNIKRLKSNIKTREPSDMLLRITLQGMYSNIKKYILDLESIDRASSIESIRLKSIKKGDDSLKDLVKSEILIRIYWFI